MPDRASELKTDYDAMKELIERWQHLGKSKVESKDNCRWYLFEKEGRESWIEQYNPEMYVYMKKHWETKGWTLTPVEIFRTT